MFVLWLGVLGCQEAEEPADWEGREPGECADGADNDGDGLFDCDDSDCSGSPDCDAAAMDSSDQDSMAAQESGSPADSEPADSADPDALLAEARDAAWEELLEDAQGWLDYDSAVGLTFAVVLDGELAYSAAMGVTQYGGGVPVDEQTLFRWNSVSKVHTALAVMQLVEAGALSLEAPVTDWLPELYDGGRYDSTELTLHRLMTHSAALPDFWVTHCSTPLDLYWSSWAQEPEVEPGVLYNDSNAGWSLAGRLVEIASGESFVD